MFKKLDKLIFKVFIGPFLLTSSVVLFIFLTQFMIKNFKHFVGKGLGMDVFAQLFIDFSLVLIPVSLPLAVLLASLMSYGTLGEHSELTAIKGAGISLPRILRPIAVFIVFVTLAAFYFNDQVAPKANLKAYSLLYDIKQKKPELAFKDEVFYSDLPGYRIKISKKHEDGETLEGVMIYNHADGKGNTQLIMAKRGTMSLSSNYLVMNLQEGNIFSEESAKKPNATRVEFFRQRFDSASFLFSLESFGLQETKEEFFKGHNLMKTSARLMHELDSSKILYNYYMSNLHRSVLTYYRYWQRPELKLLQEEEKRRQEEELRKQEELDQQQQEEDQPLQPTEKVTEVMPNREEKALFQTVAQKPMSEDRADAPKPIEVDPRIADSLYNMLPTSAHLNDAASQAGNIQGLIYPNVERERNQAKLINTYQIDIYRVFTKSFAVFVMFLIGAPLGAIIKKGGLGVPVIISIIFFIIYYIATIMGEKYAREMVISPLVGCWASNVLLLFIGLFFLKQAYADARLFDTDYYYVVLNRIKARFSKA